MKFSVLAVLSAPLLVSAQYGGGGSSPSSSAAPSSTSLPPVPSPGPGQHNVIVGGAGSLTFSPSNFTAQENDTVTFFFQQAAGFKHSVTQSSFADPCTLLAGGFDSGPQSPGSEWNLTITNASEPIWIFCTVTTPLKHCGSGMVAGINVPSGSNHTYDAFKAAAMAIGTNEPTQTATGGLTGIGAQATASATAVAAPASSHSASAAQPAIAAGSFMATVFALFALA